MNATTTIWNEIRHELLAGKLSDSSGSFLIRQGKLKAQGYGISPEEREDVVTTAIINLLEKAKAGEYDKDYSPATLFFRLVEGYAFNSYRNGKKRAAISLSTSEDSDNDLEPQANTVSPRDALCENNEIISAIKARLGGKLSLELTLDAMISEDSTSKGFADNLADYLGVSLQAAYSNINTVREAARRAVLAS